MRTSDPRPCSHDHIVYEVEDCELSHRVAFSHRLVCLGCDIRVAYIQSGPTLEAADPERLPR